MRQVAEGAVGLVLVLHQRVALTEGTQADTGFQVIHILQMRHPPAIDDTQHDLGFQHAHDRLAKLGGLLRHHAVQILLECLAHLRGVVLMIDFGHMEIVQTRHGSDPQIDRLAIPIVAGQLLGAVLLYHGLDGVGHDLGNAALHVLAVQDGVAFFVDGLALQVHDVVVLEDVLTRCEVHAFDLALRGLDGLGDHGGLNGHVVGHVGLLHHGADLVHARAAEQAHKVVFERQVELRGARVALTAGTAAQLVVDTSAFVALGADDAQAAGLQDALLLRLARCARDVERLLALNLGRRRQAALVNGLRTRLEIGIETTLEQHVVGKHIGIAAEQDVGTAARHVRGNGDGADAAGLRDDMGLALMVFRVQGLMLDATLVEQAGEPLGAFDGHRADKARLARLMASGHVVGDGVELRIDRAIDQIVLVDTLDLLVRRDGNDRQLVDLAELRVLGHSRARHARQLVVQAEVVLQGDGGKRLVLLAHPHMLFGLERLMQALGVATTLHDAARELVDDLHLAVNDHVVDVAMEQELRLQGLLQVIGQLA